MFSLRNGLHESMRGEIKWERTKLMMQNQVQVEPFAHEPFKQTLYDDDDNHAVCKKIGINQATLTSKNPQWLLNKMMTTYQLMKTAGYEAPEWALRLEANKHKAELERCIREQWLKLQGGDELGMDAPCLEPADGSASTGSANRSFGGVTVRTGGTSSSRAQRASKRRRAEARAMMHRASKGTDSVTSESSRESQGEEIRCTPVDPQGTYKTLGEMRDLLRNMRGLDPDTLLHKMAEKLMHFITPPGLRSALRMGEPAEEPEPASPQQARDSPPLRELPPMPELLPLQQAPQRISSDDDVLPPPPRGHSAGSWHPDGFKPGAVVKVRATRSLTVKPIADQFDDDLCYSYFLTVFWI